MRCPLCSSLDTRAIETYTCPGYVFHKCAACGIIFSEPMKAASRQWYASSQWYFFPPEPSDALPWHERTFLEEGFLHPNKKALNIGCGRNLFLRKVREAGVEVTAVDINEKVASFTKETLGIKDVFNCSAMDFISTYEGERFDMAVFFETLEHMENPGEFLRELRKIIKDDGRMIFSVPNRERILPQNFMWDYPPHHLSRWSRGNLEHFLKKEGFVIEKLIISPVTAEFLLDAFRQYFGTQYLESLMRLGNKGIVLLFVYNVLFKIRVIFYNLLAVVLRGILRNKGMQIYAVCRFVV